MRFTAFHHVIEFHPRIISSHVHVKTFPCVFDAMASASSKKKNYKGRSPNVLRFIDSCESEAEMGTLMPANLAAGARLAAENQSQSLDEKTARTNELRLIALENFARENGDDAVLFGPNKRPFLAATIQTFIRKFLYFLIYWFNQIPASRLRCFRLEPKFFFVIYRCRSFVSSFNRKIKNTHCFCFGLPRFYFKVIRKSL